MGTVAREVYARHKTQRIFPVALSLAEYTENEQRLLLATFRDLSRQRDLEQQYLQTRQQQATVEAAAAASREMLRYVDHELRQPLNGITNVLDILSEDLKDTEHMNLETCREHVKQAKRCSDHLLTIITDFVDIRKIESGLMQLSLTDVTLRTIIDDTVEALKPVIETSLPLVHFEVHFGKGFVGDVSYDADAARIRQVLINLIDNGLKFTRQGVVRLSVSVNVRGTHDVVLFEVVDTGIGLTPDIIANIFPVTERAPSEGATLEMGSTPRQGIHTTAGGQSHREMLQSFKTEFSSGSQADRRTFQGTGLGLRLCMLLSLMMDGTIGCRSIHPAIARPDGSLSGSVFWFEVPLKRKPVRSPFLKLRRNNRTSPLVQDRTTSLSSLAQETTMVDSDDEEADDEDTHMIASTPLRQRRSKLHFLVVDDMKINRSVLRTILHKLGHTTDEAQNGEDALAMVNTHKYDLIFMDVRMPVLGGREATIRLRAHPDPSIRIIPIIAITGDVCEEDTKRSLDAGMNEVLSKPITREAVLKIIEKMLE
eukprot:c7194_g1_i2.p1 GENE.c7194_g1_i2~~c7194_g1_i2.p1  ORF type:complete len:621 (-),score=132.57 c7194_g1_i2:39-1655(-)